MLFDASRYEFFGQNAMEEVVLGGLEDGEEDVSVFASAEDDEYHLFDKGEVRLSSFGYSVCHYPSFFCTDYSSALLCKVVRQLGPFEI